MAILVVTITIVPPGITASERLELRPGRVPYKHIVITGLGDSVMVGQACDCAAIPLALKNSLQSKPKVLASERNFSGGDGTLEELANLIVTDEYLRTSIALSDVIVIIDGANDLFPQLEAYEDRGSCDSACVKPGLDGIRKNMTTVLKNIKYLRRNQPTSIIVLGYWNVFIDGKIGEQYMGKRGLEWSRWLTRSTNAVLKQVAEQNKATYVDLVRPFHRGKVDDLLAQDGDHPNARGTTVIVEEILKVAKV